MSSPQRRSSQQPVAPPYRNQWPQPHSDCGHPKRRGDPLQRSALRDRRKPWDRRCGFGRRRVLAHPAWNPTLCPSGTAEPLFHPHIPRPRDEPAAPQHAEDERPILPTGLNPPRRNMLGVGVAPRSSSLSDRPHCVARPARHHSGSRLRHDGPGTPPPSTAPQAMATTQRSMPGARRRPRAPPASRCSAPVRVSQRATRHPAHVARRSPAGATARLWTPSCWRRCSATPSVFRWCAHSRESHTEARGASKEQPMSSPQPP